MITAFVRNILIICSLAYLVSCGPANIVPEGNGTGRLLIPASYEAEDRAQKPIRNYSYISVHEETEEKYYVTFKPSRDMLYTISEPLPEGEYRIVGWQSTLKPEERRNYVNQVRTEESGGRFTIKADTINVFPQAYQFATYRYENGRGSYTNWRWKRIGDSEMETYKQTAIEQYPTLESWQWDWQSTDYAQ